MKSNEPPKYLAYSLLIGKPYPSPAMVPMPICTPRPVISENRLSPPPPPSTAPPPLMCWAAYGPPPMPSSPPTTPGPSISSRTSATSSKRPYTPDDGDDITDRQRSYDSQEPPEKKQRKKQKEERLANEARNRVAKQGGADLDDTEPEPREAGDLEGYYDLIKSKTKERKEKKKEEDVVAHQTAVYVLECALAALWRGWGVVPRAVAGHRCVPRLGLSRKILTEPS